MPKIKTNRGAAKRFKKTGTGKIKRSHAFTSHILTSKTRKESAICVNRPLSKRLITKTSRDSFRICPESTRSLATATST